jgi:MYXO-CTERM domain-containing protein
MLPYRPPWLGRIGTVVALTTVATIGLSFAPSEAAAFCRSTTCREVNKDDCPKDENECPTTGAKLFWPTRCVGYAMNAQATQDLDPGDARAVVRKAFQAWSDVPCPAGGAASMTFEEREPISCHRGEYNKAGKNVNVVLFQDDDWKYRGIHATLAKTSVTFDSDTGEILDADIEVNTANNTMTLTDVNVDQDLLSVLTHEVGHFIGIAHSREGDAVMFFEYPRGSIRRALQPDDIQAVCTAYPPSRSAACNTEPRNGFSATCDTEALKSCAIASVGPASGGGIAALGVLATLTALRMRRWRKAARVARRPARLAKDPSIAVLDGSGW